MNNEKYLPLGTIVKLTNYDNIMIIGYSVNKDANSEIYYDYLGCPYPMGVVTTGNCITFNHDEIIEVIWKGYVSELQKKFSAELNKIVYNIENNKLEEEIL